MKKRVILFLLVVVLLTAGVSCAPRGESETSGNGEVVETERTEAPQTTLSDGEDEIIELSEYGYEGEILSGDIGADAIKVMLIADNETSFDELITVTSDARFFGRFRGITRIMSRSISLEEFAGDVKVECLRVFEEYCYTIHRVSESGYCISFFEYDYEGSTNYSRETFYVDKEYSVLERLRGLVQDQSLFDEALLIDPSIFIMQSDEKLYGESLTIEGYRISIQSALKKDDEENTNKLIITSIYINEPEGVWETKYVSKLLPMDRELLNID